jgi:hypothetical protein
MVPGHDADVTPPLEKRVKHVVNGTGDNYRDNSNRNRSDGSRRRVPERDALTGAALSLPEVRDAGVVALVDGVAGREGTHPRPRPRHRGEEAGRAGAPTAHAGRRAVEAGGHAPGVGGSKGDRTTSQGGRQGARRGRRCSRWPGSRELRPRTAGGSGLSDTQWLCGRNERPCACLRVRKAAMKVLATTCSSRAWCSPPASRIAGARRWCSITSTGQPRETSQRSLRCRRPRR